jgi:hypothetical protein
MIRAHRYHLIFGAGGDVERRYVTPERSRLGSRSHAGDDRVIGPADAANDFGGAVPRSGGCQRGPVPVTQPWEVGPTGSAERLRSRRIECGPEGAYGRSSSSASSSERSNHSVASCDSYKKPKVHDVVVNDRLEDTFICFITAGHLVLIVDGCDVCVSLWFFVESVSVHSEF